MEPYLDIHTPARGNTGTKSVLLNSLKCCIRTCFPAIDFVDNIFNIVILVHTKTPYLFFFGGMSCF